MLHIRESTELNKIFDKDSYEIAQFLADSHELLVGLIPVNPEISKTDEWNDPVYDFDLNL